MHTAQLCAAAGGVGRRWQEPGTAQGGHAPRHRTARSEPRPNRVRATRLVAMHDDLRRLRTQETDTLTAGVSEDLRGERHTGALIQLCPPLGSESARPRVHTERELEVGSAGRGLERPHCLPHARLEDDVVERKEPPVKLPCANSPPVANEQRLLSTGRLATP